MTDERLSVSTYVCAFFMYNPVNKTECTCVYLKVGALMLGYSLHFAPFIVRSVVHFRFWSMMTLIISPPHTHTHTIGLCSKST
jgi:hypothetical protein